MFSSDRVKGALIGLACGDAVGTANEFVTDPEPITDMVGGGPFDLKPGQWTDDTSMALCLAQSLIDMSGFNGKDQLKKYLEWYDNGYLSSTGKCFDIGNTTRLALEEFRDRGTLRANNDRTDNAGNGSIMRLAPIAMLYRNNRYLAEHFAAKSSLATHSSSEAIQGCTTLCNILINSFTMNDKGNILKEALSSPSAMQFDYATSKPIGSTGYVYTTLQSAVSCFYNTESFEEAILAAANLGGDSDTIAAVCGQIAGAYYGLSGIPKKWVNKLHFGKSMIGMANKLYLNGKNMMRG